MGFRNSKVTVHNREETIQGRKLFNVGNYSRAETIWENKLIGTKKSKFSAMCDKCIFWNFVTIKYSYVRIKIRETGGTCRGDSGGKIINLYMNKIDK